MYRPRPEHDRDQEGEFSYAHEPADGSDRRLPVTELALRMDGLTKSDDDSEAGPARRRRPSSCRTRTCPTPWAWN
ncbi:hypothetical protein [Streptomyces sp. NPDC058291]|uniref:hypothetical protein n=1 Tax=Streptomyces sp. NPDC058291 TaxID=3346427 RepID=UPI0036EEEE60